VTYPQLKDGVIVFTDESCVVGKRAYSGIPVLIWPEGIDETVSDWLRYLVVKRDRATSTVTEYAKVVRPFFRFCRHQGRDWRTVDDGFLVRWRDNLLADNMLSQGRVNGSIQRVFSFYHWAELRRILQHHVGVYTEDELDPEWRKRKFPLSAERCYVGRGKARSLSWQSTVKARRGNQRSSVRHTPTDEQILKLHRVVMRMDQAERNSLMMAWVELTGARRFEFLQICKSHIPSFQEIAQLKARREDATIYVKRKGGNAKRLVAPRDLLTDTHSYILHERAALVSRCKLEIRGYGEPQHIFLSAKTGKVLHPDSVTSIGRRVFRAAGIKNANIHRLRARFAIRTIEVLVEGLFRGETVNTASNWVETILVKAAELMGHGHPDSLRPYLTYVLNRRLQTSEAMTSERLRAKIQKMLVEVEKVGHQLRFSKDLSAAAEVVRDGKKAGKVKMLAAAKRLHALAEELEKEAE